MSEVDLTRLSLAVAHVDVRTTMANSFSILGTQQRIMVDRHVVGDDSLWTLVRHPAHLIAMPIMVAGKPYIGLTAGCGGTSAHITVELEDYELLVDHLVQVRDIVRSEKEGLDPPESPRTEGERDDS